MGGLYNREEQREEETWGCMSSDMKAKSMRTRAESERCQQAATGIRRTRRTLPHDLLAPLLCHEEGNVSCSLRVTSSLQKAHLRATTSLLMGPGELFGRQVWASALAESQPQHSGA